MPQHLLYPEDDYEDKSDLEIELPMSGIPRQAFRNERIEESDDDSAPEDVAFTASKTTALESRKAEKSSAKRLREEVKAKRKKRQEFLSAQSEKKKSRLEELAKKKLPEDLLKSLSDAIVEDPDAHVHPRPDKKKKMKKVSCPDDVPKASKKTKNPLPANVIESTEDFLPLDSKLTEFHVKVVEDGIGSVIGNAKELLSLKAKLMTGHSHRREPTRRGLSWKVKQAAAKMADEKRMTSK